jgi:carbonic anhydrase
MIIFAFVLQARLNFIKLKKSYLLSQNFKKTMSNIGKLIDGFRVFKATTFEKQRDTIEHLLHQGQKPSTMIISCVDIRIAPAELFATIPGELYVINNIGGLVPKHDENKVHGMLSAIEHAVTNIEVENIIVLGHAKCDGIKMMMSDKFSLAKDGLSESMKAWLSIAKEARDAVKSQMSTKSPEEQQRSCEHESIIISLKNLMQYPYISERMKKNKLNIFGWHFNIQTGDIMAFNPDNGFFEIIS